MEVAEALNRIRGIEVNVIGDARQGFAAFDVECLVTTLEWVAHFITKAVESNRPRALQPFHSGAQIRFRGFQRQVKMVPHDDECMQRQTNLDSRYDPLPVARVGLMLENPAA
jgi:hypothetical protein